jgi:hypothetical protein
MKKFISLLLVFSVIALSTPLSAKEKKGADLIIQKTDGTQVRGELIAVKENSFLLIERDSGADVTVDIGEVYEIRIVKASKVLRRAGTGTLIGAGIGGIIGAANDEPGWFQGLATGIGVIIGALVGLIAGVIVGVGEGVDESIQIEGKSDSEIQEILEKLRKKARIKNAQ